MQRLSHIISNHIFIFATSIAMLVHSTWTFGTLFSGQQPVIDGTLQQWVNYALWVIPALLVALAIDIGQIQTSVKITRARSRRQQASLGITFFTLAAAGYYLQWFHLAHHIPALEFGAGLSPDMRNSLEGLKAIAIFIVPAMLPLSIVLYTLSSDTQPDDTNGSEQNTHNTDNIAVSLPMIEQPASDSLPSQLDDSPTTEDDTQPVEPVTVQPANIESSITAKSKAITESVTATNTDEKHCEECGKPIKNARHNQRYCNASCRQLAYRKRQKATA